MSTCSNSMSTCSYADNCSWALAHLLIRLINIYIVLWDLNTNIIYSNYFKILRLALVRFAVTGLPGLNLSLHGTLCPSTGLLSRNKCLWAHAQTVWALAQTVWALAHTLTANEQLLINLLIKLQRFPKKGHFWIVSLAEWAASFAGKYLIAASTYAVTKENTVH